MDTHSILPLWTRRGQVPIANPRGNTCPVPVVGLVTNAMEEDKNEEVDPGQSMVNVDNKITLAITIKNSLC